MNIFNLDFKLRESIKRRILNIRSGTIYTIQYSNFSIIYLKCLRFSKRNAICFSHMVNSNNTIKKHTFISIRRCSRYLFIQYASNEIKVNNKFTFSALAT